MRFAGEGPGTRTSVNAVAFLSPNSPPRYPLRPPLGRRSAREIPPIGCARSAGSTHPHSARPQERPDRGRSRPRSLPGHRENPEIRVPRFRGSTLPPVAPERWDRVPVPPRRPGVVVRIKRIASRNCTGNPNSKPPDHLPQPHHHQPPLYQSIQPLASARDPRLLRRGYLGPWVFG